MSDSLEYFFDFASPYAYLAHVRLPQIANRHGCGMVYRPVDLAEVKRAAGNIGPATSHLPTRQSYVEEDTARWAKRYGVVIRHPAEMQSARLNQGVFLAMDRGVATQYVDAVGQRVWAEGAAMNDDAVLARIAQDMGWDAAEFIRYTESPAAAERRQSALAAARDCGVFGVPTVVLGERMWWGNDRLSMLEAHLTSHDHEVTSAGNDRHG